MYNVTRIWFGYGLLAILAIPWYWQWIPAANLLLYGVPAWVVGAITGSVLVSCYTAWLLGYAWPDEGRNGGDR